MPHLYRNDLSNHKANAQRNLDGRTHYVDPETLRYHKSRVSYSDATAGRLLFALITKEPEGYRFSVFDLYGFVADREPVDDYYPTLRKAEKALKAWLSAADAKAITREALIREQRYLETDRQLLTAQMEKMP
jgi:hypothetical protein